MPLSRLLKRGDRITVVVETWDGEAPTPTWGRQLFRARVTWTGRGLVNYVNIDGGQVGKVVRRRDEGRTWARGWDGEDADALRATYLLQRSAS